MSAVLRFEGCAGWGQCRREGGAEGGSDLGDGGGVEDRFFEVFVDGFGGGWVEGREIPVDRAEGKKLNSA